jgi:hypothetical protein
MLGHRKILRIDKQKKAPEVSDAFSLGVKKGNSIVHNELDCKVLAFYQ